MEINKMNRNDLIKMIKKHPHRVMHLDKQDAEICKVALDSNFRVLCVIREQTEELCLYAVRKNWEAIQYVREQTPAIIQEALKQSSNASYYVDATA